MRVLFSCFPSEGHFSPLLPLARALAGRGHELAFAVAPAWQSRVAEESFVSFGAGPNAEDVQARFEPERAKIFELPPEQRRPLQFTSLFARLHAPEKLAELLDVAREWGADAIVYDSGDLAAPIAAATLGIASVNHSFGAMIPFAALEPAARAVEPLWREQGLEPDPHAGAFRGLFVDLAPESFAWERPLGRVIRMRPGPGSTGAAPGWLDELEPPLVYVTLGTVWNRPAVFRVLLTRSTAPSRHSSRRGATSIRVSSGRSRRVFAWSASCRRRMCFRARRWSCRTAAPGRRSARSPTRCRLCSCRRPRISSTTRPAPRRPEPRWFSGRRR